MGYYSRVSGTIEFRPPVPTSHVAEKWRERTWSHGWLRPVTSENGLPYHFDTIEVTSDEDGKAYYLREELEELVEALGRTLEYSGMIHVKGEEGDQQRLYVQDGEVIEEQARLLWPDGSTEGIR